jgi:hypothetical protein
MFVRGVVMSSTAKAHKRKDGTGVFVIVRHELALQPGLAVWEAFHDPKDGAPASQKPLILLRVKIRRMQGDNQESGAFIGSWPPCAEPISRLSVRPDTVIAHRLQQVV